MRIVRKDREQPVLTEEWHGTKDGGGLLLLKYPSFEETGLVKHGISTRYGGVSKGIFSSMNLSFSRGDDREAVMENFRRLAEALEVDDREFVFTDQTHTTNIRKVTAADAGKGLTRERDYRDVDGLITDEPGLVLSTFYADCVPLLLLDPVHRAIGLSHSGWRGTVGRMGAGTVAAMQREYGSRPQDLLCAVGPSICQDCYEVGDDVAKEFRGVFAGDAGGEKESAGGVAGRKRELSDVPERPVLAEVENEAGRAAGDAGEEKEFAGAAAGQERALSSVPERTVLADVENEAGRAAGAAGEEKESAGGITAGRGILRPGAPGKYQLDLWRANEIILREAGILAEHIAVTDICTCCNPDVLFSHRASHGRRGNFGAFLCLR